MTIIKLITIYKNHAPSTLSLLPRSCCGCLVAADEACHYIADFSKYLPLYKASQSSLHYMLLLAMAGAASFAEKHVAMLPDEALRLKTGAGGRAAALHLSAAMNGNIEVAENLKSLLGGIIIWCMMTRTVNSQSISSSEYSQQQGRRLSKSSPKRMLSQYLPSQMLHLSLHQLLNP